MGWLFFKKKKSKIEVSAKDLIYLLQLALDVIDSGQIEYEIRFTESNHKHRIGIGYDRAHAPKGRYDSKYMTIYLDNQVFNSVEGLFRHGFIFERKFSDFKAGIMIDKAYRDILEAGNVEVI